MIVIVIVAVAVIGAEGAHFSDHRLGRDARPVRAGTTVAELTLMPRFALGMLVLATACGGGSDAPTPDASSITTDARTAITTDVTIDSGPVHGMAIGDLVVFEGIPYAHADRWMPPTAPEPWTSFDATVFGPACPQAGHPELPQDEACLSLNIWAHADGKPRPAIVWIHGGGFVEGSSREVTYDGAQLADTADVDVVSINYRLGVLGFLALPQLQATDGGIGNYGIRDQIAALAWVKRNLAAFGGDPTHVMIAGESAGGAAVCLLLTAPGAQGLFSAAAIESGPCQPLELTQPRGSFPAAEGFGAVAIAAPLGCTSGDIAACLKAKTVDQILALSLPGYYELGLPVTATFPVRDGVVLDQRPFDALSAGRGNVPVIVGSNHTDASVFALQMGITDAAGQFAAYVHLIGRDAVKPQLDALYPTATFGEFFAATAYATDAAFACSALGVALHHQGPTYLYELERAIPNGPLAPLQSVHGYDFINLFGTFAAYQIAPEAADLSVSMQIQKAWGELAHGTAPTAWPIAPNGFRQLDGTSSDGSQWRGGRCAQLAALGLVTQ